MRLRKLTSTPSDPGLSRWKVCADCHERLPVDSFWVRRKSPDGLNYRCKRCSKAGRVRAYQAKKVQYNQRAREYYAATVTQQRTWMKQARDACEQNFLPRTEAAAPAVGNRSHCSFPWNT